jgi:4'-phosphopantetheinyl transferase
VNGPGPTSMPGAALRDPVELHLYRVPLRDDARAIANAVRQLSPAERTRAARFRTEPDHRRYVLTRARLREVVGLHLHIAPHAVTIEQDARGKPALVHRMRDGLHFNCTHAGDLALVALAAAPVGIDIEHLRPLDDVLELADAQFSATERAALRRAPAAERSALFLHCWTHKEAVLKATGAGIADGMRHFDIALDQPSQQFSLPDLRRIERPRPTCAMHDHETPLTVLTLAPAPGYVAAVAAVAAAVVPRWKA